LAPRRARLRGARPADRDARPRAGGGLGPRPVPQPPRDRLRGARGGADARGARADLRRRDRHAAGTRGGDPAAAPPRSLMHALLHPWSETFMQLALADLVLLGIVGGV